MLAKGFTEPTERVKRLKRAIVDAVPCVESERAVLVTEAYKETEGLSPIMRRAKAAEKIFNNLPVTIHEDELIVGAITKNLRSTEICPEFSFDWVESQIPFRYLKRQRQSCTRPSSTGREGLPVRWLIPICLRRQRTVSQTACLQ